MDRVYKEERNYILGIVKKIKASGCNVLLIQKSILRWAFSNPLNTQHVMQIAVASHKILFFVLTAMVYYCCISTTGTLSLTWLCTTW
jgi:hypothetical protein